MSVGSEHLLSPGQLNLIAKRYGAFNGTSLLDVGCGNGEWVSQLRGQGVKIQGIEERQRTCAEAGEALAIGSPAASLPGSAHSFDRVLFRGTSLFSANAFDPELMIALANMGSVLKPYGRLIIPIAQDNEAEFTHWNSMLSIFPGEIRARRLTSGLSAYLTLAFLFGGVHTVSVLDFHVGNRQVSRLEWHKLAREAVLKQVRTPEAA